MNGGRTFRAKDHEMLFPNQYKYTTIFGKEHEIRKNQVKLPPNTPKVIERSYLTKNRYLSKPYDTGKVSKVTGDSQFFHYSFRKPRGGAFKWVNAISPYLIIVICLVSCIPSKVIVQKYVPLGRSSVSSVMV